MIGLSPKSALFAAFLLLIILTLAYPVSRRLDATSEASQIPGPFAASSTDDLTPGDYFARGTAKASSGDCSGATEDLNKAVSLDPAFKDKAQSDIASCNAQ